MSAPVIDLRGVRCVVAGRAVLDVPRLVIMPGERVALVGANGAGKSTLLRLVGGFVPTATGAVAVLGESLPCAPNRLRALRNRVGHMLQQLHLVSRLSARENVLIGLLGRRRGWRTWLRWPDAADRCAADAALSRVGIAALADVRVDRLSGGERQKVAVARMLLQAPELVLADEPTAALDPQATDDICTQLVALAADATLIVAVHNPALLPRLATRVIGLAHGAIVFDLPTAQVDAGRLSALYAGHPAAMGDAAALFNATAATWTEQPA